MFARNALRFTRFIGSVGRVGAQRGFASRLAFVARPRATLVAALAGTGLLAAAASVPTVEAEAKVPIQGVPGTVNERTFIAIKPDGVQRQLIGDIISRFEKKGYKLVAMKLVTVTPAFAAEHYDDLKSKPFFPGLTKFFASGPICAMVWEGPGVIKGGRRLLGETNPADSLPGTIRGDLCVVIGRNICHGSDSPEGAAHEIPHWFKDSEINTWTPAESEWLLEQKK